MNTLCATVTTKVHKPINHMLEDLCMVHTCNTSTGFVILKRYWNEHVLPYYPRMSALAIQYLLHCT